MMGRDGTAAAAMEVAQMCVGEVWRGRPLIAIVGSAASVAAEAALRLSCEAQRRGHMKNATNSCSCLTISWARALAHDNHQAKPKQGSGMDYLLKGTGR